MKKIKRFFWVFISCFVLLCLYLHMSQDNKVGTLILTGVASSEEVEWKNPSSALQKASLPTHEVLFSFPKKPQLQAFFWGDLIGIRYKQLQVRSFFRIMGWSDFIEVEALCSDYLDLDKKLKLPSKVLILQKEKSPWWNSFWNKLFKNSSGNFFIKEASLQIKYLPLDGGSKTFVLSSESGELAID